METNDPRPAKLYSQGGNTVLAISRAHCRKLGWLPRTVVIVTLTDDGRLLVTSTGVVNNARTRIRERAAREAP